MKTIKLTLSDPIVAALLEKTVAEQEKYSAASVTFPKESQLLISAGDKIKEIFRAAEGDKPIELDTSAMKESSTQEFTKGLHYTLENYFLALLH